MIAAWTAPDGGEEYAVAFDRGRARRVLVLPALFDEANKLRHFTVEVMRRLVPTGNEVPALLEQVSNAARRAGLDISSVEPQPVIAGEPSSARCFQSIKP